MNEDKKVVLTETEVESNIEDANKGEEKKVIQSDAVDGQTKCPQCGSTDIALNPKTGLLHCNFCRNEFSTDVAKGLDIDVSTLEGETIGSGAKDIVEDAEDIITLKCSSCGAEVVIDTASTTQARCHWCRNTLSINSQVPNGAVPDIVLPFKYTKEQSKASIDDFIGKRKFYAHPKFKKEFCSDNVMGVYFPYVICDVNATASFNGQGEHETRRYVEKHNDKNETYYDADVYDVKRDFDVTISNLSIEASADKLERNSNKTNNIINSIMPFDVENSVTYNANYLKGFSSEKRDVNVDELKPRIEKQAKDVARYAANDSLEKYDRGVRWDNEELTIKGTKYLTAYLPVWLYSYQQGKAGKNSLLHYIALNARTGETMGSVPINKPLLVGVSVIIEILALIAALFLSIFVLDDSDESNYVWALLVAGFLYYTMIFLRYRNTDAKHHHESETKREVSNLVVADEFVTSKNHVQNATIVGSNNMRVDG